MSNDFVGISTDENGNYGDYTNAYVDVDVKNGSTDITSDCSYSITTTQGVTGLWDAINYRYSVFSMSTDNAIVTITIQYNNITASKDFKLSKIKDGKGALRVEIDSSAGVLFKNSNISSILTCRVFRGDTDVTNSAVSFDWWRQLPDGTRDQTWNRLNSGNVITITSADVISKAVFRCDVTI